MSDYYSQQDRHSRNTPDYYDNVGGGSGAWLWIGIALFALVALIAAIFSGGVEDGTGAAATTGAEAPATVLETPAPADAAPTVTE